MPVGSLNSAADALTSLVPRKDLVTGAFLMLFTVLAIPLNLGLTRRYQRQIDDADALRKLSRGEGEACAQPSRRCARYRPALKYP